MLSCWAVSSKVGQIGISGAAMRFVGGSCEAKEGLPLSRSSLARESSRSNSLPL